MMSRTQITLEPEIHRRARERASQLGISFAEYVRRVLSRDLGEPAQRVDPALVFNLDSSGGSDVARHKDALLGEAVAAKRSRRASAE